MDTNPNYLMSTPQLHFIVGAWRSGTTLLSQILHTHPKLAATIENPFIIHFQKPLENKTINKQEIDFFFREAWNIKEASFADFRPWEIDKTALKTELLNKAPLTYQSFCKTVYQHAKQVKAKGSIKAIIDKNPPHTLFLNELLSIFPNARFIGLIRDPRANIASRLKYTMDPNKSIYFLANSWNYFTQNLISFKSTNPNNILLVKYEDLILQMPKTLQKISTFLSINYTEDLLNYNSKTKSALENAYALKKAPNPDHFIRLHGAITQKPITSNIDKWKNQLTTQEQTIINSICSKTASKLHYELPKESLNIQQTLKSKASSQLVNLYYSSIKTYYKLPFNIRSNYRKLKVRF